LGIFNTKLDEDRNKDPNRIDSKETNKKKSTEKHRSLYENNPFTIKSQNNAVTPIKDKNKSIKINKNKKNQICNFSIGNKNNNNKQTQEQIKSIKINSLGKTTSSYFSSNQITSNKQTKNKVISNFNDIKMDINKSDKIISDKNNKNLNGNYETNIDHSDNNKSIKHEICKVDSKTNLKSYFFQSKNLNNKNTKKVKYYHQDVIFETHEIDLEEENKLKKIKHSRSQSTSYLNRFNEKENTTKEKSFSTEKNKSDNNKMETSDLNKLSIRENPMRSNSSMLKTNKNTDINLDLFNKIQNNNENKLNHNITLKNIIETKLQSIKSGIFERNSNHKILECEKNPFSLTSFKNEEKNNTPKINKDSKNSRSKLTKTNSCANIGVFLNRFTEITIANKNENEKNIYEKNENEINENEINEIEVNNNDNKEKEKNSLNKQFVTIKKDENKENNIIHYKRNYSMTNLNCFNDFKIKDKTDSNPFKNSNGNNNSSNGTKMFTIKEKYEKEILNALVHKYYFSRL